MEDRSGMKRLSILTIQLIVTAALLLASCGNNSEQDNPVSTLDGSSGGNSNLVSSLLSDLAASDIDQSDPFSLISTDDPEAVAKTAIYIRSHDFFEKYMNEKQSQYEIIIKDKYGNYICLNPDGWLNENNRALRPNQAYRGVFSVPPRGYVVDRKGVIVPESKWEASAIFNPETKVISLLYTYKQYEVMSEWYWTNQRVIGGAIHYVCANNDELPIISGTTGEIIKGNFLIQK